MLVFMHGRARSHRVQMLDKLVENAVDFCSALGHESPFA